MARRRRGRRGRGRHRRAGLPLGPRADRLVRLLRPAGEPAARERRVEHARQLPRHSHRLSAARRAGRLDRRHPGVRPDRGFLYDASGMLSSWLRDLAADQLPDGTVPWYVPVIPGHEQWTPIRPGAAWGDAAALTPWDLYTTWATRRSSPASTTAPRPGSSSWSSWPARTGYGTTASSSATGLTPPRPRRPGRRAHRPPPGRHRLLRPFGATPGRDRQEYSGRTDDADRFADWRRRSARLHRRYLLPDGR